MRIASHIDDNVTPINSAPKTLSTGMREGISTSTTGQLKEGLSSLGNEEGSKTKEVNLSL
jgi:hypothetical protein